MGEPIQKQIDVLEENRKSHKATAYLIAGIYATALIGFIFYLFTTLPPKLKQGNYPLKELGILFVLIIISVQSSIFYTKFVTRIKDSLLGHVLSIAQSVVFFILTICGYYFGESYLIGLGTIAIGIKTFQLYLLAKEEDFGRLAKRYLLTISISYLVLSGIILYFGIQLERETYFRFQHPYESDVYRDIQELLDNTTIDSENPKYSKIAKSDLNTLASRIDTLSSRIDSLNSRYLTARFRNDLSLVLLLSILIIIMLYAVYKAVLIRDIQFQTVIEEIKIHYESKLQGEGAGGAVQNP